MQIKLLHFIYFSCVVFSLCSQPLGSVAGTKPLNMPAKYVAATGETLEKSGKTRPGYPWVIFSDRVENVTYTDQNGSREYKRMNLMESFWVIDESSTHVRIVKYNLSAYSSNTLNTDAIDYGWAPKDKMLLWDSGLIDAKNGFTQKAFIKQSEASFSNEPISLKNATFYDAPSESEKWINTNHVSGGQLVYIFKEQNDFCLVGIAANLRGKFHLTENKKLVIGWVPKELILKWNTRLCLEPNWDTAAVEERKRLGVQVGLTYEMQKAIDLGQGETLPNQDFFWQSTDNATEQRRPEYNRLPVFSYSGERGNWIFRTGKASSIFDKNGREAMAPDEQDKIEYGSGSAIEEYRKMNIVFVIDGSSELSEYYESIANALKKTIDKFQNNTINKYNLGVVMYRDYSEAQCPSGDRTLSTLNLTTNKSQVISFIEDMASETKECSRDNNKEKSLFYGLKVAADMLSPYPNQLNSLVIIGATGNETTDSKGYTIKPIGNELSRVQCNIMTFQVKSIAGDMAFDNFVDQTDNLIKNVYTQVCTKISSQTNRTFNPTYEYNNGSFILKNAPIVAVSTSVVQETPVKSEQLGSKLTRFIEDINQQTEDAIIHANQIINGNVIKEVRPDLAQKIDADNKHIFLEGYTPYQIKGLKYPLYKYEIFISINEVAALKLVMSKLFTGSSEDGLRENIVNTYKEVLAAYYGPNQTREAMNTKSASEILELVTGLPTQSELLTLFKANDFLDPKVVSDNTLQEIVDYLREKYEAMSEIVGSKDHILRVNDETYHYLPQDVLP